MDSRRESRHDPQQPRQRRRQSLRPQHHSPPIFEMRLANLGTTSIFPQTGPQYGENPRSIATIHKSQRNVMMSEGEFSDRRSRALSPSGMVVGSYIASLIFLRSQSRYARGPQSREVEISARDIVAQTALSLSPFPQPTTKGRMLGCVHKLRLRWRTRYAASR